MLIFLFFFLKKINSGYLIPKGWKVMPLFRNIHHSPDHFPDPETFDPSRFEVKITFLRILVFLNSLNWDNPFFAGCSKTQYFHAIWQWGPCMSWKWVFQAGDFGSCTPSDHKIQVVYGGPTEWDSVWALCSSPEWIAHKSLSQRFTQLITLRYYASRKWY